jgi:excisionase family DNA binding protein
MRSKTYTTAEAAKAVGISRQTIQTWIKNGWVKPPKMRLLNRVGGRLWTQSDLERLRRVKPKTGRPRKQR